MSEFYDKEGKPIEFMECGRLFEDEEYQIIKQETLPNGRWVSTVWLGLNHRYGDGAPLIFETMVFPEKDNFSDEVCERYSTLAEAEEGHKKMVEKICSKK